VFFFKLGLTWLSLTGLSHKRRQPNLKSWSTWHFWCNLSWNHCHPGLFVYPNLKSLPTWLFLCDLTYLHFVFSRFDWPLPPSPREVEITLYRR
jgi:hypothetical protein